MLRNLLRLTMFLLLLVAFYPLLIFGIFDFMFVLKTKNPGISGTAYEPLFNRILFHHAGTRDDCAAVKLAPQLPALSSSVARLLLHALAWASRLSGYQGSFLSYPGPRPSSLSSQMGHRTAFFDEVLAIAVDPTGPHPVQQVVFLGAGWDTRSYGMLRERSVRVFEVDTPATQRAKQQALKRAGLNARHVTFVETDFGQTSWLDALTVQGFDPALPTFILREGVTCFLEEQTVQSSLRKVSRLAAGSQIDFNAFSFEFFQGFLGQYMKLVVKAAYGDSLQFFLSTEAPAQKEASDFVAEQGLTLSAHELVGGEHGNTAPMCGFVLAERCPVPSSSPSL